MAIWPQLLTELEVRVLSFLDPNELAGSVRLVCKATATLLPSPKHTTIRLSQRVPPHAFAHRWGQPGAMRSLTYKERLKLLRLIAASGSIPNLEFLLPRVGCLPTAEVLAAAAAAGQLSVCQWLRQRGCPWGGGAAEAAGRANYRQVCEWLIAAGCPDAARDAAYGAARGGHVGLLEWLLPQFEPKLEQLLPRVAEGCDLATLQRLHAKLLGAGNGAEGQGAAALPASAMDWAVRAAARSPTPDWRDKVDWLLAAGYPRSTNACAAAGSRPDALERLAWLWARGFQRPGTLAWETSWMAEPAHLVALERLLDEEAMHGHRNGINYRWLASHAAEHGHLELLRALHERGHVGIYCMHAAALRGHLSVMAWVVEALGKELLTPEVLCHAAKSGRVELLAWLRKRGCPWDYRAYVSAADTGCAETLEWLAAHGCPMEGASGAYGEACCNNDQATLACLRRLGCPWDADVFTEAVICSDLPILRWLAENGCPVDWDAALEAADANDVEVMAWLEEEKRRSAAGSGALGMGG